MKIEVFKTKKDIRDIKIAILADIHYHPNYSKRILNSVLKQLEEEKPNYLTIVGDILDRSNYDPKGLIDFLKKIDKGIKIIIILGNHDIHYRKKKLIEYVNEDFINSLKKLDNCYLLRDTCYRDNNICFYGFDLDCEHYYCKKEKYTDFVKKVKVYNPPFNDSEYNILLFHSPVNIYTYIGNNPNSNFAKADLIISGHMHNGVVPYAITNLINKRFKINHSLVSPSRRLFPRYAQGRVYKIKDGIIYEGLSKFSKSSGIFHYFDFIYHKRVKFITIEHY